MRGAAPGHIAPDLWTTPRCSICLTATVSTVGAIHDTIRRSVTRSSASGAATRSRRLCAVKTAGVPKEILDVRDRNLVVESRE